jgi:DMATS type aromatic prenyltransferase
VKRSGTARDAIAQETLLAFGVARLNALLEAVDAGVEGHSLVRVFRRLVHPWGLARIGEHPRYPSNVADDEAPFEFCLAISKSAPEIQFYVEPQGDPPGLKSNMLAGRALLEAIAGEIGAPLDRFRKIEDLFFPEEPSPPFTLWFGVSWIGGRPLRAKVYLNPQVRGPERAFGLVTQALDRLGFARAWATVKELLSSRPEGSAEVGIFSLDLAGGPDARAKIYVRHHQATVEEIATIANSTGEHAPTEVAAFYHALADGAGPFVGKPAVTEIAFVEPGADRPAETTLAFPIGRYVESDEVACDRIRRCIAAFGLSSHVYDRAIHLFTTRPLADGPGIHAHATLRRIGGQPRIAVYLASEAYGPAPYGARVHEERLRNAEVPSHGFDD